VKIPNFDIKDPVEQKERNFRERLKFQDLYIEWMKTHDWSAQQKSIINKKSTRRTTHKKAHKR
jgi:hypothetical protein